VAAKLRYGWLLISIAAACGGKSVLYVEGDDSSTGGEPEPPPAGGRPGAGGTTGAGPAGGTFSGGTAAGGGPFTGGTFTGGAFSGGGVSNGGTFPRGGTGATPGTGGTPNLCADLPGLPPRHEGIVWDESGVIDASRNGFGVQGRWYSADDCSSALGLACTIRDPAFTGPDGQAGWDTRDTQACASGVAPRVGYKPDGTFAYSKQWGFLLGFTLNHGDAWNADERCVQGVEFNVTGTAPGVLRVNLPTTTTQGVSHFYEVPVPGFISIPFSSFAQGSWVTNPVPLDTSALTSLEFHVFTNASSATRFSFCVSDVRFLYSRIIP